MRKRSGRRLVPLASRLCCAIALLLPAACATPEAQLRTGLVNAGLSQPMAACMAPDMAQKLTVTQLLRLRSLSKVGELDPMRTSIERYLHQVRALRDPEILTITSRAAARCALGL